MIIKPFKPSSDTHRWNNFILNSKNGTFLLNRNFMDYHADKFIDNSLMFYNVKDKLIAILPANIQDNAIYSHQGLSYGGLIYDNNAKITDILECFKALKEYAYNNNIKNLIYKRIPYIYYKYPADEDLYALFVHNAKLIRRDIGFVINIKDKINWNTLRTRCLKKATKNCLEIKINTNYENYYAILLQSLNEKHNTKPVHSVEEMVLLANKFPQNIKLICSYKNNHILCGVWLFIEKNVIHTQYIAISSAGKQYGAFEIIINFLLQEYKNKQYLSFGISTEQNGRYLNEGLAWQKESFGGRGICYDFYELTF